MDTAVRQRLLRVAGEAEQLARVRSIATTIVTAHEEMRVALRQRDPDRLSAALRTSQKAVEQLKYVLRLEKA